jgi:hypothetical protein
MMLRIKRIVLTRMVGIELSLAFVVRQFPVESAYGLHALPPVLRKGFGSGREGVADDPFIEFMPCLNIRKYDLLVRVFCKNS